MNLQSGTTGADVDRSVQDSEEEFSCEICGEDAHNCCCFDEFCRDDAADMEFEARREI